MKKTMQEWADFLQRFVFCKDQFVDNKCTLIIYYVSKKKPYIHKERDNEWWTGMNEPPTRLPSNLIVSFEGDWRDSLHEPR